MKPAFWHFATDSDWGEDSDSGIAIQPDHFPNTARPNKKKKRRRKKHKTDAICPTCKNNHLVNGSCPQCSWGDNPSVPIDNFPLDPVKDDRAGIRAAKLVQNWQELASEEDWSYAPAEEYARKGQPLDRFWFYKLVKVNDRLELASGLIDKATLDKKLEEESGQLTLFRSSRKMSEYSGWSNWDTFVVAAMIENDPDDMNDVRNLILHQVTVDNLANWAIQMIVGPFNQKQIANAQEWNSIPYEDRPVSEADMPPSDVAEEIGDMVGFDDPRSDVTPETIDESLINWQELYDHFLEIVQENEKADHEAGSHLAMRPICPLCNPSEPTNLDAPGDTTFPETWEGF